MVGESAERGLKEADKERAEEGRKREERRERRRRKKEGEGVGGKEGEKRKKNMGARQTNTKRKRKKVIIWLIETRFGAYLLRFSVSHLLSLQPSRSHTNGLRDNLGQQKSQLN